MDNLLSSPELIYSYTTLHQLQTSSSQRILSGRIIDVDFFLEIHDSRP